MFTTNTVFILGAGASADFGFPLGTELVAAVAEKAKLLEKHFRDFIQKPIPSPYQYSHLLQKELPKIMLKEFVSEQGFDVVENFGKQCGELARRLDRARPLVIDNFLQHNPDLQDLATMLIAWVLLEVEAGSPKFFSQRQTQNADFHGNWHPYLIAKLLSEWQLSDTLASNRIHFVTFNYDRSLESGIFRAISANSAFAASQVHAFIEDDQRFIHVYGRMNSTPELLQLMSGKEKDNALLKRTIDGCFEASSDMRTIQPMTKDDHSDRIERARTVIAEAQNVYILGYGFDETNSHRLDLHEILRQNRLTKPKRQIYFTNLGDSNVINKRMSKIATGIAGNFMGSNIILSETTFAQYEKSTKDVLQALKLDIEFH